MEVRSLVGYGVSSDSEEEEESSSTQTEKGSEVQAGGGERKTQNFLLESGSASSESSSDSEPEEEPEEESAEAAYPAGIDSSSGTQVLPSPFCSSTSHKLPPPPLGRSGSGGLLAGSSVFANPFKDRAEEKLNVLQRHVPLTQQARPTQIGGKRMCVAYRKDGRCRFGIRCKFAHDSDLQNSARFPTEAAEPDNNGAADQTEPSRSAGLEMERGEVDEEEEESRKRKKHRVGLSNTLIPPKRAMKQYAMQRDNRSSHC